MRERDSALLSAPVLRDNGNQNMEEIMRSEESSDGEDRLHQTDQDGVITPMQKYKQQDPSKTHFGNFGALRSLDEAYLSQGEANENGSDGMGLSQYLPIANHNASMELRTMNKTMT